MKSAVRTPERRVMVEQSDAARDGCVGEPALLKAVEIAKEFLRLRSQIDSDKPMDVKALQKWQRHAFLKGDLISKALLSLVSRLETAREEMVERCADVADHYAFHSDGANRDAGKAIARRIRSLSVK